MMSYSFRENNISANGKITKILKARVGAKTFCMNFCKNRVFLYDVIYIY